MWKSQSTALTEPSYTTPCLTVVFTRLKYNFLSYHLLQKYGHTRMNLNSSLAADSGTWQFKEAACNYCT